MQEVGDCFLFNNQSLTYLILPSLETVGNNFISLNENSEKIECPKLQETKYGFLQSNTSLKSSCEKKLSGNVSAIEYIKKLLYNNKQKRLTK